MASLIGSSPTPSTSISNWLAYTQEYSVPTPNVYQTIVSKTGKGFLHMCQFTRGSSSSNTGNLKITVDGTTYIECRTHSSGDGRQSGVILYKDIIYSGGGAYYYCFINRSFIAFTNLTLQTSFPFIDPAQQCCLIMSEPLPYNTSLLIEYKCTSTADKSDYNIRGVNY